MFYYCVFVFPGQRIKSYADTTSYRCGKKIKIKCSPFSTAHYARKMLVVSGKDKKVVSRNALYSLKCSNTITLGRDALLLCRECMVKNRPRPDRFNDDPRSSSSSSLLSAKTASETGTAFARVRDPRDDSRETPFGSLRGCRLIYAGFTRRSFDYEFGPRTENKTVVPDDKNILIAPQNRYRS